MSTNSDVEVGYPLYHFTCPHGRRWIGKTGLVMPHPQPLLGNMPLAWFTTQAEPDRELTGLTMELVRCDRMKHRYVVTDASKCFPWLEYRYPLLQRFLPRQISELEVGHDPQHWFIASAPVPVRLDVAS